MSFNYDKFKIMNFGNKNTQFEYVMELKMKTFVERDLGIMISNDLKWSDQIKNKASNAAKSIIAQLRNSFNYFDAGLVRLFYVSLIKPYLEYAVPVWSPNLKKTKKSLKMYKTGRQD